MATPTKKTTPAAVTKKVVTPENRAAEIKTTVTKKDVLVIRNVICKFGTFEAGKTYTVDTATENKLKGLDAIKC